METLNQLPRMRDNLPALRQLAETLPKGGLLVKIGSFAGESTRVFLEAGLHVHAINPWDNESRDRLLRVRGTSTRRTAGNSRWKPWSTHSINCSALLTDG